MRIQETLRCIIIALTVLSFSAFGGEITVYTNLESDEVADYVKVVQKDLPDIKINVPRLSTGDLAAQQCSDHRPQPLPEPLPKHRTRDPRLDDGLRLRQGDRGR